MEALECIKTRRSIRKFTEQPVTEDEVRQVVELPPLRRAGRIRRSRATSL